MRSPKSTLLRMVPELDALMICDDLAQFILDHAASPTYLDGGHYKEVVALGNGNVARIFRTRNNAGEDPFAPDHPVTRLEAVPEIHETFRGIHVEIMPRLGPVKYQDYRHLVCVLSEHNLMWGDDGEWQTGVTADGRLQVIDGALVPTKFSSDSVRFYMTLDDSGARQDHIAVIGNETDRWFFRWADQGWIADQSLGDLFHESPQVSGVWLRSGYRMTIDEELIPELLSRGDLAAIAGGVAGRELPNAPPSKTLGQRNRSITAKNSPEVV